MNIQQVTLAAVQSAKKENPTSTQEEIRKRFQAHDISIYCVDSLFLKVILSYIVLTEAESFRPAAHRAGSRR